MRQSRSSRRLKTFQGSPCSISLIFSLVSADLPFASALSAFATGYEGAAMTLDYILGGAVTAGLFAYLVFALLRPEKF
jgi:K+-transporting ATPase KdpF subunit